MKAMTVASFHAEPLSLCRPGHFMSTRKDNTVRADVGRDGILGGD